MTRPLRIAIGAIVLALTVIGVMVLYGLLEVKHLAFP